MVEPEPEEADASQDGKAERGYIKFEPMAYPGLCFFGMKIGKDDDDTSSWAMPAFLALALPLVTNTKVVISEMSLPLFASGHEFRETVIFDAPHPYLDRLLKEKRVRVDELLRKLRLLSAIYRVNLDTYAKQGKPEWKHLNGIARDLDTDPLFLFSYLKKQQRGEALYTREVLQYIHIFVEILEENLGNIQQCVDRYTVFYRGCHKVAFDSQDPSISSRRLLSIVPWISTKKICSGRFKVRLRTGSTAYAAVRRSGRCHVLGQGY